MADEIEHIWPKSFYPERTFSWENYLYVCGPCNGAKGNQWDLFVDEGNHLKRLSLERIAGDAVVAPPDGDPLFIDPTQEDPFDFLFLDLTMDDERLEFCPLDDDKDSYNYQIAQFTIDALKLNERADLSRARYTAFTNYRARIAEYVLGKQAGFARTKLDSMVKQLKKESHPTVWHSILRYYQNGWLPKVDPEFAAYFDKAPEALSWI